MSSQRVPPPGDAALLMWSSNVNELIGAHPSDWGLVAADATAYNGAHTLYATKYADVVTLGTRTRAGVIAKNEARQALLVEARQIIRKVNAAAVTNEQRAEIGFTIPSAPSTIPVPATSPEVDVAGISGNVVVLHLHGPTGGARRSKPAGCAGALVYTHVGTTPPMELSAWVNQGITTRTSFNVVLPPTTPAGSTVLITACWYNPRGQTGVACSPITVTIGGGVPMAA